MQVDPIKPTLKAPGTERLNLKFDEMLSIFAFNSNLRRYISVLNLPSLPAPRYSLRASYVSVAASTVGASRGRGLHSLRYQLNLSSSVHRVTQLIP